MVTPVLPVEVYIAYIVVKRKKPTHSVEYVVCICNAHSIIKSHNFGVKYIHLVTETSLGLYT